jgi:cytoskeletal protein CcmA (bactofilin family)
MPSPTNQVQLTIVEDVLGELIVLEAPAAQIAIGPQLSDTAPVALGTAAAGTASSAARGDHVHAHGNLSGSSLHALASTSAAGFMSTAQFDLLAAATDDDDASTLVKRDSLGDFSAGTITANLTGTASAIADNTVTSAKIVNGSIVDADINANAEIAVAKLADGAARQLLQTAANGTDVEWASNIDIPGTLDVTGAATFDGAVTIQGDLTVNGTETIINTQTLDVEDKNIVIGKVDTPTDTTADGGGITLKGTTDKTINWVDATDAWTFSEHIDLASTKEYRIAGAKVLDATSLGSAVVTSSLTSVGTIGTGTWQGTAIADIYLETIATAGKVSNSATTADSANTANAIVARDASGNFSAGTITAALTGNADTATKLNSTRTFAVTGDITGTVSSDLTAGASIATSIAAGVIVDADVNASAAIAGTKISPNFGTQTVDTSGLASLSNLMLAFAQRGASIGIPGQPLFGVGPAVTSTTPVGIGPHDYYPIDLFSGSFM